MVQLQNNDLFSRVSNNVAACIDKLGTGEFYPRFFQMMKALAVIDQYMVFEFSPNTDYASCRLAHNVGRPELGVELASLYLEGAYLEDPLLQELRSSMLSESEQPHCRLLVKRVLPNVYRKRFFNVPSFESKFSFVLLDRDSQHLFYINFYSKLKDGFERRQQQDLEQACNLIGALLLKHFRDERKSRGVINSLLISGLSEREAQICSLILKGHTAKSIGHELSISESTVITYKKRAYAKLQIKRKSQLIKFV